MVLFVWTVTSPTAIQRNVPTAEAKKEYQRRTATENEERGGDSIEKKSE